MIFKGKKITLEIVGGSHDEKITLTIKGLPQNQKLDENKIKKVSARPSGMRGRYADELLKQQKGESNEGDK